MSKAQKTFLLLLLALSSAAAYRVLTRQRVPAPRYVQPLDTRIVDNNGEIDYQRKTEWIEKLHSAAPGVDWRTEDMKTRTAKYAWRKGHPVLTPQAGESAWREIGSNNLAGRMHCADYDAVSGLLYCASSGGNVWRGDLNGNGWTCLNEQLKMADIKSLRVFPLGTGRRIVVCASRGVYYSDDEGGSWNAAAGFSGPQAWGGLRELALANDAGRTMYVLAEEWDYQAWCAVRTVYRSTDAGTRFSKITSFAQPTYGDVSRFDIWTDPRGNGDVYFVENANVYLIAGTSLTKIAGYPLSTPGAVYLTGRQSGGETHLYVLVAHDGRSDIYGSDGTAGNWTYRGVLTETPFMTNSFECGADFNRLFMGGVDGHWSADGGASWATTNSWTEYYNNPAAKLHADICGVNSVKSASNAEIVLFSTDGGMYWSSDGGVSVHNISLSNLNVSQYYSVFTDRSDAGRISAGSQDQGYQVGSDALVPTPGNLTQIISGDYGQLVSGDGGQSIWCAYPGFAMYVSHSTILATRDFPCSNQFWLPPLMADPQDPQKAYFGGGGPTSGGAHLYLMSFGAGQITFEELPFDFCPGTSEKISAIACSPLDPAYRYVMTSDRRFYSSTDAGATWTKTSGFSGPPPQFLFGSCILPSPDQLGWVYLSGSGYSNPPVYLSNDNGTTFSSMSSGLPSTLVTSLAADEEGVLYAATEVGPYAYLNGVWTDISQAVAPDQSYNSVEAIPGTGLVRFGTYGRGIWEYNAGQFRNPVPQLGSVSPEQALGGGMGFTLTLLGTDFVSGSIVRWNGENRATSFVSSTELQATISAGDIAKGGQVPVTVVNPAPGGGISSAVVFGVADFTMTAPTASATVSAGQSAAYSIVLASAYGTFDAPVTLSCTALPQGCSARFSPASVVPGATGAATTLALTTKAPGSAAAGPAAGGPDVRPWGVGAMPFIIVLLAWTYLRGPAGGRRLRRRLGAALVAGMIIGLAACSAGGDGDNPPPAGTPKGTYQITVNGTSGSLTVSTTLTLIVN